jgi:hypothetical protein
VEQRESEEWGKVDAISVILLPSSTEKAKRSRDVHKGLI